MNKRVLFSSIIFSSLGVVFIGGFLFFNTNTVHLYGTIPEEYVTSNFDKVEYTLPIVDEEGNHGTQTFIIEDTIQKGKVIKLYVRNDKVKKYEFISKEDLPEKVKKNL
ncbi:YxeA family protein [Pseudogracilibacillus sp. SE30717A]|uniref:YxeA family protein n=1 Tax=Pseudogracilibacillus sp. SE30717A TaxID=3098293 RepID=UPI00300E3B3F